MFVRPLYPLLFFFGLLIISNNISAQDYFLNPDPDVNEVISKIETPEKKIWTFTDCLEWAVKNNNDVRRALLSVLEAEENIGMAKDAYLPSVGFNMNHAYTNFANPAEYQTNSNIYGSSYNINASWTIWEGNVRKYRLESARLLKQQQKFAGDDIIKELELGILQAYLNILYASETIEIAKQSLEVSSAQAQRTKRLMETGRTSRVDYQQIESQKAQDEYTLVQAQTNYASAVTNLKNILNLGLDYELEIADIQFPDSEINIGLPDKVNVFDYACSWLPLFRSNELNKDLFDYNIKIAKGGYLPSISLNGGIATGYNSGGASWGSQMGHGINENIGLNFSIPIYDANQTKRAIALAKLDAINYDLNLIDLKNQLSQTIDNLYIESQNSRAKYKTGLSQLESAELTDELVNRQFDLGLVNPLELLTAHNNLLNARLELLQSKYMAILSNKTINYYATSTIDMP